MKEEKTKDWKKFREESEQALSDEEVEGGEEADGSEIVQDELGVLEHPSYTLLEEKLTEAEQLAFESKERAARALAELENVRRRTERDIANAHKYGQDKLVSSLLPVIDSLEQAIALTNEEAQEGLKLTLKLLVGALEKCGVEQIDPVGELFNPQEHEAMSIQETPDATPNSVVMVFQKGYKLNERVIRPARVIVAKN